MYQDYPTLSEQEFSEVLQSDRGVREAHFSHGYQLRQGISGKVFFDPIHKHNLYVFGSKNEYKITPEQQAKADKLYALKKAEAVKKALVRGALTLVTMGSDYDGPEDCIRNYRVRTYFLNKKGRKYFIEIGPGGEGSFTGVFVDCTFEEGENERFRKERTELIEKFGAYNKIPIKVLASLKQPRQRTIRIGECPNAKSPKGRKFTFNDVRVWINATFDCNFKTLEVDRYFLSCNDYVSKC